MFGKERTPRMKGKMILYLAWAIGITVVVMISVGEKRESTAFYGIAETREISVNSEKGVGIKKIHFTPGQTIPKNALMVELNQPELEIKINEISHQLEELKIKKLGEDSAIKSQINQLEAQAASTTSDINYKIKQIESQHNINKELTTELKSFENYNSQKRANSLKNPMNLKIESLHKELEMAKNMLRIKVNLLRDELNSPGNAYLVQMESLAKELTLLNEEKQKLLIYSQIAGIIGSVNYKEGEKVSPFTPILTLHAKSPSYVIGYIHENVYNKVAVGDKLDIVSLADRGNRTLGEVSGIGSRIIEYPIRLRRRPEIQLWGREVQIKIPPDNNFLLGEKVLISAIEDETPRWDELKNRLLSGKRK
jgi:multidrug resistance efflux pump